MLEKRKSERVTIKVPIVLEILSVPSGSEQKYGEIINCVSENISSGGLLMEEGVEKFGSGGLFVKGKNKIDVGCIVKMQIDLPLPGYNSNFFVKGEIIRTIKDEDTKMYYSAIKFGEVIQHNFSRVKLTQIKKMLNIP